MINATRTNEFSVVLLLDEVTSDKISQIRKTLRTSPIRTDPPHMTLLRGISSIDYKSDNELLRVVEDCLGNRYLANEIAIVGGITMQRSEIYGPSSIVEIQIPQHLVEARNDLFIKLEELNYIVEDREKEVYDPHVTITLGVPLPTNAKLHNILKPGDQIRFSNSVIFRIQIRRANGIRLVRMIAHTSFEAKQYDGRLPLAAGSDLNSTKYQIPK